MAVRRLTLGGIILLFSFFAIYGNMNQNKAFAFFPFLIVIIAALVLYQSFSNQFPQTGKWILLFFAGRLFFIGLILFVDSAIFYSIKAAKIHKDGISTYGVATGISSRYLRGHREFYRHFRYVANDKIIESTLRFSYDLNRGDTLYLKYSRTNPYVIEFEDNKQNRRHGIVK